MIILLYMALMVLPPEPAAWVAATVEGRPDIAPEIIRVCQRESRCNHLGVHKIDARPKASSYAGQVKLKHLDPECQPKGDWKRWGTRGAWGLNAADMWKYLPKCYAPEVISTGIAAHVAVLFYLDRCEPKRTSRWCPKRRRRRRR